MPILRFAEGLGMSQPCFPHGRLVTSGLKNGDFVKNGDLMTARVISETRCEHRADNRPCYSHVPFYGLQKMLTNTSCDPHSLSERRVKQVSFESHFTAEKGEGLRGEVTCGKPARCSRETVVLKTSSIPPLGSEKLFTTKNHPSPQLRQDSLLSLVSL